MKTNTEVKNNRKEYTIDSNVLFRFVGYINNLIYRENDMHCRYREDTRIKFKSMDEIDRDLQNLLKQNPEALTEIKNSINEIIEEYVTRLYSEVFKKLRTELSYDSYIYQLDEDEE